MIGLAIVPLPRDPSVRSARALTGLGIAAAASLIGLVASLDRWVAVDDRIWRAILLLRGCGTDDMVEQTLRVATALLTLLFVAVVMLHVRRHGIRSAWPWMAASVLGLVASRTLKHLLTRERPSSLPDVALGYSFPSAHVMNSLIALLAVIALTEGFRRRKLWLTGAGSLVALVAAGRLVLGRHWALDLVGGILAALAFVGLVVPVVDRRPRLAPAGLLLALVALFAFDNWIGETGLRLPAPLVGEEIALRDVDVGADQRSRLAGDWREAADERPGGSLVWLEGAGTIQIDGPRAVSAAEVGMAESGNGAFRLALSGRPASPLTACTAMSLSLNGHPLGRFVPYEGWREYRLPVPPHVLRAGPNELTIESHTASEAPWRFAVARVRLAAALAGD